MENKVWNEHLHLTMNDFRMRSCPEAHRLELMQYGDEYHRRRDTIFACTPVMEYWSNDDRENAKKFPKTPLTRVLLQYYLVSGTHGS